MIANFIYVALGSALGGLSRYYFGIWMTNWLGLRTPATVLINIAGSFAIGLFLSMHNDRGWSNMLVLFVSVGFLGGFTTFSTFSWQTLQLAESDAIGQAVLNIAVSVLAGLAAVWLGSMLPKWL